jgi:hypothetical protein
VDANIGLPCFDRVVFKFGPAAKTAELTFLHDTAMVIRSSGISQTGKIPLSTLDGFSGVEAENAETEKISWKLCLSFCHGKESGPISGLPDLCTG